MLCGWLDIAHLDHQSADWSGMLPRPDAAVFNQVLTEAGKRSLKPKFADCKILHSKGDKRLGAVAGIVRHLADEQREDNKCVRLRIAYSCCGRTRRRRACAMTRRRRFNSPSTPEAKDCC